MSAVMQCSELARAAEYSWIARRNNSLSSTGRLFVLGFIFVVSVGIACGFAYFGAWPILPFAGLEMLALFLAFRHVERHAADYERIAIAGDRITVEFLDEGRTQSHVFNRWWAQVMVSHDGERLALRAHGRELDIGRHLTHEQRLAAAQALKRELVCRA